MSHLNAGFDLNGKSIQNCYVFTLFEIVRHLEGGQGDNCHHYICIAMYSYSGFADALPDLLFITNCFSSSKSHDDLLWVTLMVTGFHGLLRLGEMTFPDSVYIRDW